MRLYVAVFGGGQLRALCVSAVILPFLRVLRFFSDVSSSVNLFPFDEPNWTSALETQTRRRIDTTERVL
jgi:hypothetical protein